MRRHVLTAVGVAAIGVALIAVSLWMWLAAAASLDIEERGQENLTFAGGEIESGLYDIQCASIRAFASSADSGTLGSLPLDGYVKADGSKIGAAGALQVEINRVCEGRRTWTATEVGSLRSIAILVGALGGVLVAVGYFEWRLGRSTAAEEPRVGRAIVNAARK